MYLRLVRYIFCARASPMSVLGFVSRRSSLQVGDRTRYRATRRSAPAHRDDCFSERRTSRSALTALMSIECDCVRGREFVSMQTHNHTTSEASLSSTTELAKALQK